MHVARGHAWSEQLARCFRLCRVAANRGLGPPKRAAEVRIACIADASRERILAAVSVVGGFLQPHAAWLVACWWLLREVELAGLALHVSHVSCDEGRTTLHLPMSKADTGGLGKSRTLRCICHITALGDGGVPGGAVCASCTAQAQVALMERACGFTARDERAKLVPLFPCSLGRACSKDGAVASWQALAGKNSGDHDQVSGHSARRSGAKLLARCGWAAWQIQFWGRWGSDAVRAYTEEVFAETAETWPLRECEEQASELVMFPEDARVAEAARRMDAPARGGAHADVDMGDLAGRVAAELERRPLHVKFLGHDGKWHIAASWGMETLASDWKTRCGWRFAQSRNYRCMRAEPPAEERRCSHCHGAPIVK